LTQMQLYAPTPLFGRYPGKRGFDDPFFDTEGKSAGGVHAQSKSNSRNSTRNSWNRAGGRSLTSGFSPRQARGKRLVRLQRPARRPARAAAQGPGASSRCAKANPGASSRCAGAARAREGSRCGANAAKIGVCASRLLNTGRLGTSRRRSWRGAALAGARRFAILTYCLARALGPPKRESTRKALIPT
jgi:hypothetical protein